MKTLIEAKAWWTMESSVLSIIIMMLRQKEGQDIAEIFQCRVIQGWLISLKWGRIS
jgi:hypothetical protein